MGFMPMYFAHFDKVKRASQIFTEESAKFGRPVKPGQRQNIVRWVHICDSEAEYNRKLRDYELDIYKNFYGPFFPQFPSGEGDEMIENIKKSGIYVGGTVAHVRDEWVRMYQEMPSEYITLVFHYAQQPKEDCINTISRFMTEVWPHLEYDAGEAEVALKKTANA
jgi:hypothetical protein